MHSQTLLFERLDALMGPFLLRRNALLVVICRPVWLTHTEAQGNRILYATFILQNANLFLCLTPHLWAFSDHSRFAALHMGLNFLWAENTTGTSYLQANVFKFCAIS